jgi:hypothetical protein
MALIAMGADDTWNRFREIVGEMYVSNYSLSPNREFKSSLHVDILSLSHAPGNLPRRNKSILVYPQILVNILARIQSLVRLADVVFLV